MDYKNILEGTRPFFQGLPLPSSPAIPVQLNSTGGTTSNAHQSPMSLPQNSSQSNPYRMKFEEGLGATLSQMYNTVSPTLRIPASSSSPKNSPSGGPSPGSREHHLNLRGGSSATIPPASPASSVLNIPLGNTLSASPTAPRTSSGSAQTNISPNNGGPGVGVRRESPLDLSVKTVRQSADSSTNNNLPEGSSAQPPGGNSNCVVNSTAASGTRSLSSSGASTPNNSNAPGAGNSVSSVIAAVANSTTGKDAARLAPPLPTHNTQNSGLQQHQSTAEVSAQSQMASTPGYASSQSHHLFGVGYHSPAPVQLNIPGGHDPAKIYSHHYLQSQHSPYRLPNPQQHQQTPGSHNFQSPISSSSNVPGNPNQNQSGSVTNSSTATSTPTTPTAAAQSQQPPQSRSSVIPPYNPPQPTFGLGAYHHHSQQQTPTHTPYHAPNPYGSYHIQQPGPGPGQNTHPYYAGHYGPTAHASPAHPSSQTASSPAGSNQSTASSASRNVGSSLKSHEGQPAQQNSQPPSTVYQNHSVSNAAGSKSTAGQQPQRYGHPTVTPNASPAHYPSYPPHYYPHLTGESPRSTNQATPKQATPIPATPQSRQTSAQYPLSYPYAHAQSPSHYPTSYQSPAVSNYSNHYQPPPASPLAGTRSPHPNQIQSHYYSYLHQTPTPRPIPPPQTLPPNPQSQLPSGYPYPSHLNGPRPPAPPSQAPPTGSAPPSSYNAQNMSAPLNVPTPKAAPPPTPPPKSPAKQGRAGGGPKTGEKRKNLLNLLRNSLETRIHEKQEKEKVNHRQTWNFHGKKYHNPLPPPASSSSSGGATMATGGGAGGSILTGLSHQGTGGDSQNAQGNGGSVGNYPGLFGINQRTNFVERQAASQGALSPNTENSLNRIRTKAEKKQVFPNLLSQIEQENANKQQLQQSPFGGQQQSSSVLEKYKKYNAPSSSTSKTSVFDFQDEDEEARVNLSLSRRSPGHSTSPVASISSVIPPPPPITNLTTPKKRSGSKKFTSKLNKWIPPVGVPGDKSGGKGMSTGIHHKSEISVVPVPTTSSYGISSSSTTDRVPAIDNMDEFWATCDSFLDDLSANPTTIKSRRGGLWAKIKSNSTSKEKKSKGRRRRRASAEVDADFEIEEEEEEENGVEGDKDVENSESSEAESEKSKSSGSTAMSTAEVKGQDETEKKEESDDGSGKNESETEKMKQGKRKSSGKLDGGVKKKKKKRDSSMEEVKGRKVGKRMLRERRSVGSLVTKSLSDLDDQSSGESDESDVSVASFSISSDDSRSANSDSSTDSDDSSDSNDGDAKSSDSDRDDRSVNSKGSEKVKKKVRSGSTKGQLKLERRRSTRNSSLKRGKRAGSASAGSVGGRDKQRRGKKDKRKLRPTRNCAKGKLKEISGEMTSNQSAHAQSHSFTLGEEERGSSGEEWIMRGELGKRKKEKCRVVYGDGSEFRRPGWEEELIDFKKKLRMPSKLIRVAKPSSLSSTPSGKGKEDPDSAALQPVVVISPAKSTKENKSPAKSGSQGPPPGETPAPPPVHVPKKGRPPKNRTPQKEGEPPVVEKPKKSPKTPKGKKNAAVEPGSGTKGGARPTGKGKKGKGAETTVNGDGLLREERDKGLELLPTPGGGSGVKFNKKMSIKSVLGVVIPSSEDALTTLGATLTPASASDSVSTPSTAATVPVPPKKALRRNKFKSGFDYIRKKKKAGDPGLPPPPKRTKASQEKNMTEDDVQNELRCWVLNKGLGETILHRAARLGYPDVAAYTLEHDICSPNCKDNAGYSPLHETCMKGNLEVAKILLAYGANPSQAAPGGIRPLHEACENGHVELVRLLIAFGADPLLATYAGQTPMELAEHHKPVKKLLEQHIRDVQGREEKPWEFRGSGKWADERHDSGFDVTEDPPVAKQPPSSDLDLEEMEFEASELPLPPIYMLKEDVPYILLQDLINYLGLPKDRILKSHPGAELVELNSNDFLEDVHCRALLGVKFRLNLSSDLLALIKYDDVVKKMLNIESCFIK